MTSRIPSPSADDAAKRRYWTEHMEQNYALLQAMATYPIEENLEALESIPDAAAAAGVEMAFSDTKIAGDLDRVFAIRIGLVADLIAIARDMNARGWILKIEDGFRTREMQTQLGLKPALFDTIVRTCQWEHGTEDPPLELVRRRATCLVANYPYSGTHTMGAAVDVSVLRRDDVSEVWRGYPYLEMSVVTPMESPFIEPEHLQNRLAITAMMARHGFLHYPGEFWHYKKGDPLFHVKSKTGAPASYGPVHWDAASGMVTPFDDTTSPFIPPGQLATQLELALERFRAG